MTSSYRTPRRDAEAEIEVRRSRFLCTIVRVEDEAAARAVVDRLRKEHHDARHHCSAFVLGPDAAVERSNDDGEPSGTAGAPMLEVLRGAALSDVVAVVTRWFGGTLLGAGGLVRAYGDAVRAGLDAAGAQRRDLLQELLLEVGHTDAGHVESALRTRGIAVLGSDYAAAVTLRLGVAPADVPRLHALVAELTSGAALATPAGERWVDTGMDSGLDSLGS
ncbi:YigZ family protein [Nocardioides psychrotolerans]|uniref:YigZ family protein n=1 Tax=Nocardioides psychrotolerans TaxID=1005945 RepID=UPI001C3F75B3|nr:YigZ family protein [Nocardioides psychrotolerans]